MIDMRELQSSYVVISTPCQIAVCISISGYDWLNVGVVGIELYLPPWRDNRKESLRAITPTLTDLTTVATQEKDRVTRSESLLLTSP